MFEAVVEDLEIKRKLFARVAAAVKKTAIVTTNTSGLGIAAMSAGLPADFRRRFLGTHFFNPPRYLKLLEIDPRPGDGSRGAAAMDAFARPRAGQGRRALQGHARTSSATASGPSGSASCCRR